MLLIFRWFIYTSIVRKYLKTLICFDQNKLPPPLAIELVYTVPPLSDQIYDNSKKNLATFGSERVNSHNFYPKTTLFQELLCEKLHEKCFIFSPFGSGENFGVFKRGKILWYAYPPPESSKLTHPPWRAKTNPPWRPAPSAGGGYPALPKGTLHIYAPGNLLHLLIWGAYQSCVCI